MSTPSWADRGVIALSHDAECAGPDSEDSPGAKFLISVRDSLAEAIEYGGDPEDSIHEIADGAPDVYTYTRWQEFVDLGAWDEDHGELGGGDCSDMTRTAGICLYIIAERLCRALLDEDDGSGTDDDDDTDDVLAGTLGHGSFENSPAQGTEEVKERLEYLRGEIEDEQISYGELSELQDYGERGLIPEDDILLREWAGLPEFPEEVREVGGE